ncbi:MAG: hypothetical protein ACJA2W_000047 [Planctomycetota bacterium]|jgi:hypothetical protein
MLVFTAALACLPTLFASPPAGWIALAQEESSASTPAQTRSDGLRLLRVEIATAALELSELGSAQKALDRCDAAAGELIKRLPDEASTDDMAVWVQVASALSDVHTRAVAAGATASKDLKATWERLEKLSPTVADGESAASGERIDQEIRRNARVGNFDFILQVGSRAVPGVVSALDSASRDHYADPRQDPLYMLMKIDPVAADQYVGELLKEGPPSLFWELRFARAIELADPFAPLSTWKSNTRLGDETRLVHLAKVCDQLLPKPELTGALAKAMLPFTQHRSFTRGMRALLDDDLEAGRAWHPFIPKWFTTSPAQEDLRGLLVRAISSPNAGTAIDELRHFAGNDGLYEAVLGATPMVREDGHLWLKPRAVYLVNEESYNRDVRSVGWTPSYGPEESAFLEALLTDKNANVRADTLKNLKDIEPIKVPVELPAWPEYGIDSETETQYVFPIKLSDAALTQLVMDLDERNYRYILRLASTLPHDSVRSLIIAFDQKSEAEADLMVGNLIQFLDWTGRPKECVNVAAALLDDSRLDRFLASRDVRSSLGHAYRTPEGLVAVTEWALASENLNLCLNLAFDGQSARRQLAALPGPLWAQLVSLVYRDGIPAYSLNDLPVRVNVLAAGRSDNQARLAAVELAASNPGVNVSSMFGLLLGPPPSDEGAAAPALLRLLSEGEWADSLSTQHWPLDRDMKELLGQYSRSLREEISRDLLSSGASDMQLAQVFHRLNGTIPITPEIVEFAITHTDRLRTDISLVDAVIHWTASHPSPDRIAWIGPLMGDLRFGMTALKAAETLRDPALLPHLAKIVDGPASSPLYEKAVYALKGYLSDEGAELLLTAARKTSSEETRTWCLEHVERIAALQDAEDRWATRRVKQATRDVTVSRLMGLLGDADPAVRIEAIKGLGTWEAVEAMPELIGFLKDPKPEVAAAARATLDRLNQER